jgi:sugar (pentulose or hexulose) kinase
MATFLGLDLGTTTACGLLLDAERGHVLHLARRRNDAALEQHLPTRAEQDPRRLLVLAVEVLAELAAQASRIGAGRRIEGLGVTGQMHGLLCVDAEGGALTPLISWQDRRTAECLSGRTPALGQLHARLADLDWRANGCRIQHGYGAATLFWLAQQDALPAATHRVCTLADWLVGRLTGLVPVTDSTLAASWGVYNLLEGAWNVAFLETLALDEELFPLIRPSGALVGGLATAVAQGTGLPVGLPVHNAVGDSQASFLGSVASLAPLGAAGLGEAVADIDRAVLLNLGTGGQIAWAVPAFEPPSERVETRPLPLLAGSQLVAGHTLRLGASLCGGAAYAWLNRTVRAWLSEFGVEASQEMVYERLNALAAGRDDTAGLSVRTTFLGVRGDPALEAGAIEGITPDNLALGALARATLVGLVDELRDLYRAHGGVDTRCTHVIATGGALRNNPLLPALIEERFGLPVRVPAQQETAAAGAALLASSP